MSDPGNTLATAQLIAINAGSQTYTDAVSTADPEDYYRFTLSGRSSINLALTGLSGNADLQVLNGVGTVLQQSTNAGTAAEDINLTDLSAGVYYVRVFAASGTTSAQYTFAPQASSNVQTDILWRNYSTGQNTVWTMNGTTYSTGTALTPVTDPNWRLEGAADFNSDGQADLVWRQYSTGQNRVWLMQGNTFSTSLALDALPDPHWHISGTADFNRDGQTDLLWRHDSTGQNILWLLNGTTYSTGVTLGPVPDVNWQINGTGDFNRDGQTDILWRNYSTGQNLVWLMQDTTYSTGVALTALADVNWRLSGTGDFNHDGQTDLLWRNYRTGQNVIWLMNGTTVVSGSGVFTTVADLNWQIAAPFVHYGDPGVLDTAGNTTATAFAVGTLTGQATYTGSVNSADDDYYKFTLLTESTVSLALNGLTANGNIALSGNGITTLAGAGSPTRTIATSLNAGTYYVWIHQSDSGLSQYSISLNATPIALVTATPLPDIGGNTPTTAFNIGTLSNKQTYIDSVDRTDNDYYTFTVSGTTFFDLWLDGLATTSLVLTGNGISFTPQSTGDQMKTITTSLTAGTYSIHISQAESNPSRYNLQLSPAPLSPGTSGLALGDFSYDHSQYGTAVEQQAYYYGYNASFHAALAAESYDVNRNVDWSQADPETASQQSAAYAGGYEDGYWDAYFGKVYQATYSSRLDDWNDDNYAYYGAGGSANYSQWLQAYDQHYAYRLQHPTYENGSIYANPGSLNNYLMRLLKAFNAVPALAGQLQQLDSLNTLIATGAFYAATQAAFGQTAANLGPDSFFSAIWTARSVTEIDAAAATLAAYLDEGGDLLSLADYERRLLRAANLVPVLQNQMTDAAFVSELLGLGNVYASLNPTESTTSGAAPLQFFLNTSWQAQNNNGQARQTTAKELEAFLKEFDEPVKQVKVLNYEQKILTALKLVPDAERKLQDVYFVEEKFDFAGYMLPSLLDLEGQDFSLGGMLGFCLDVLESVNQEGVLIAANKLQQYILDQENNLPLDYEDDPSGKISQNRYFVFPYERETRIFTKKYNDRLMTGVSNLPKLDSAKQLDWKLVIAMIFQESPAPPYYDARKYDPMQVANKGDEALSAVQNRTDRTDVIATDDLRMKVANKGHTPSINGEWNYRSGTQEQRDGLPGHGTIMDSTNSIEVGIVWLFAKKAVTPDQGATYWDNWRNAVYYYNAGPNVETYTENIFKFYKQVQEASAWRQRRFS